MSLRTARAELLALLQAAEFEVERAEEARRKTLGRKKFTPEARDAVEANLYAARQKVRRIRREIARIEAVLSGHEAERAASKAAKLAAATALSREFKRARSARRQERKRLAKEIDGD